jgi:hypothetical protein
MRITDRSVYLFFSILGKLKNSRFRRLQQKYGTGELT